MTKEQCPEQKAKAVRAAMHLTLCVFYRAGYFMSIKTCALVSATPVVHLGIVCDSDLCQFEVPGDKLAKLQAIIAGALEAGMIMFAMSKKLAGKCTSMTVAVPAASLYTFHMYKQIGKFQRRRMSRASAAARVAGNLSAEMKMWLELI